MLTSKTQLLMIPQHKQPPTNDDYFDNGYHDGFKNGIAELAYDNEYSAGYDNGSYEPNYNDDSASDYYSDYSYDDSYYPEAPERMTMIPFCYNLYSATMS